MSYRYTPFWESHLDTTRRDLLSAALTLAGATATSDLAQGEERDHHHDHAHQDVPSDPALRVKALETLLVAKGLVDRAALDAVVDNYEHKVGPHVGARVVARAWKDSDYKRQLLADGTSAEGSFTGDGPIDAVFQAIDAATGVGAKLSDFTIGAVTEGQDALGEVSVVVEVGGYTGAGQGISTDIIDAAARAYLRALSVAVARSRAEDAVGLPETATP